MDVYIRFLPRHALYLNFNYLHVLPYHCGVGVPLESSFVDMEAT